ncbi:MAG TPA: phage portal protein [Allosphingosinicella sp.]|jgi:HK97 family phage portal protein
MGFLSRLGNALAGGAMELPKIRALGLERMDFEDLRDPRLAVFLAGTRQTASGLYISERLALRNSAIYRSLSLITGAIGMLPLFLMRRIDDDDSEKARDHPLFQVLHKRPNSYQTPFEFKAFMQYCALADGNAYAMIVRRPGGGPILGLYPLKRGAVEPRLDDAWNLVFRYTRQSGGTVDLSPQEVFHFRAPMSLEGLKGLSLLDMAAEAIGIAAQAEKAAARLFRHGSFATGALKVKGTLSDEAFDRLRGSFEENYAGAEQSGKPFIFEEDMDWATIPSTAKEAQHLETRKFQAEEVSRFTGVPRPLLMFDETSWGSGIQTLGQFFVTYGLQPWFTAWEEAIWRSCLTMAEQALYFAKFNAAALLRGSPNDQAAFVAKALGAGGSQPWMTPNEARSSFDMNHIEGGDALPPRAGATSAAADEGAAETPSSQGKANG